MASEGELRCPICLDRIRFGLTTNCEHKFCGHCVLPWLVRSETNLDTLTCPACREIVTRLDPDEDVGEGGLTISHLAGIYSELYDGLPSLPVNARVYQIPLLTGVRDVMIEHHRSVVHIQERIDALTLMGEEHRIDVRIGNSVREAWVQILIASVAILGFYASRQ